MIIPVVQMPSLGADGIAPDPDTLVTRLGFLSEVVLSGSGAGGVDVAGYKSFLRACPCRVGPFDVLSADDRDAKVGSLSGDVLGSHQECLFLKDVFLLFFNSMGAVAH